MLFTLPPATFIVHTNATTAGVISLQNAKNTLNWLAIRDGKFIGDVSGIPLILLVVMLEITTQLCSTEENGAVNFLVGDWRL